MPIDTRLLLLLRRTMILTALLALTMLLALGCGGDRRGGGGDDDDNNDDSAGDDDTGSDDDDDTGSDDDDDTAGDDDTGSGDDDTGSGTGVPSVESVDVCEQTNPDPAVISGGPACDSPCFYAQFTIVVTDSDGDLQNPTVYIATQGSSPQPTQLQGDLGSGAAFGLIAPGEWPRGGTINYSISIEDAAGNRSQDFPGTWAVPASTGQDDCPQ